MANIETDYLVIGAGASGMAFVDELITRSDGDVVIVDRRDRPGGHWNDAYPFVRLHQASAHYGVNSAKLGNDQIDTTGPNAGFYESATGAEICEYYQRVLDDRLLASGRVRFFGSSEYVNGSGGHQIVSRIDGGVTTVRVRRKIVDATYMESSIPATHTPSFTVDPDARSIPVGDLVNVTDPGSGYTVIGAGKTAMDACNWLLDAGVSPEMIRWIRPRDAWMFDRASFQPLDLLPVTMDGLALGLEAAAQADDVTDLFMSLESCTQLVRLDASVEPTMFKGAITSPSERESLRRIERVVRLGHIVHLGTEEIALEHGSIGTDAAQIHVDCTADGLPVRPVRPVFEPGRITIQTVTGGLVPFNAALVAFLETTRDDDAERNRLCPPNPNPSTALDYVSTMLAFHTAEAKWLNEPDLAVWLDSTRLSLICGMSNHMDDPRMTTALERIGVTTEPALMKLAGFLAPVPV